MARLRDCLLLKKNVLEKFCQSRLKVFEGKLSENALPSPLAHLAGFIRMTQERFECLAKAICVTVRHEQTRDAVLHNVRRAAMGASNHRLRMCHGFKEDQAKSFSPAGQREHIAVGIARGELFGGQAMEEAGAHRNALITSELLEPGPIVAIAHEREGYIRLGFQDAWERRD